MAGPIGNASDGVTITNSADNTIGGAAPADRNLISGNRGAGVDILGGGATGNQVLGNWIGTNIGGTSQVGNALDGVLIENAPGNVIGQAGAGNVISGNDGNGIQLFGAGSSGNVVLANLIGTDASGTAALGNSQNGVLLNNVPGATIGGTSSQARNVISGNASAGVAILSSATPGATGNVVLGNLIGTDSRARPRWRTSAPASRSPTRPPTRSAARSPAQAT